jgi:hypothetical protein
MKSRHATVTDLATHQPFGNDAYDFTAFCKRRVCQSAHQTDATATKYNADAAFRQQLAQAACCGFVGRAARPGKIRRTRKCA